MKKSIYILLAAWFCLPALAQQAKVEALTADIAGDNLMVSMTLLLDDVQLKSNRYLVYVPTLDDGASHVATLRPVMLTGRRQHIVYLRQGNARYPDAMEVRRWDNQPQAIDYKEVVAFEDWMQGATLRIMEDSCGYGDLLASNELLSIEVQKPEYHPEDLMNYAFTQPQTTEDPVLSLKGKAYLDFPVNRTELYPDYRRNPEELRKIINTIDTVRNNSLVEITAIRIHGYASPEGSYRHNVELAQGRAQTLRQYVSQLYSMSEGIYQVQSTPEDWDGLREYVTNNELPNREQILAIINSDLEPDAKDNRIRQQYPQQYSFLLKEVYPALRHSDYEIDYRIRPMSIEEAKAVLRTQPELLSLNKMYLIAQTYEAGSDDFNQLFDIAVRIYPDDPVTNLNAANVALKRRDTIQASRYLEKTGNSAEAENARGVYDVLMQNYDAARLHFEQASQSGLLQARENLKALEPVK